MEVAPQHVGFLAVVPQGTVLVMGHAADGAREAVRSILKRRGHSVEFAPPDFNAIAAIDNVDVYDLLVLDLDIHDAEAVQLCAQLRQITLAPLLVLVPETARNQGILALELGADSFVVMPFDRRELVARSEALVRRYRHTFLPLMAR